MRKICIPIIISLFTTVCFAQRESVSKTVSVFPFQEKASASNSIINMQQWKTKEWKSFYMMLDDDSLQLKATYALSAYIREAAVNIEIKKQASPNLVIGLNRTKSFYAQNLIIQQMSLVGDDVCIKGLVKKLNDEKLAGPAARALASINSHASKAALNKALANANEISRPHIQAAIDFTQYTLPNTFLSSLTAQEKKEGFVILFDGTNMDNWVGNKTGYLLQEGNIVVNPKSGGGGNLYTKEEYADFIFRFEFQLTPGANNGLGIRTPMEGDAAYVGMELQILDNEAEKYKTLQPYQYHGSVYGVIPAKRGFLKAVGEWNQEEVIVKGTKIKVILNGEMILDGDIKEPSLNGTMDHNKHPGLLRTTGHIGFLGHGDVVKFRRIRVKSL